MIKRIVLAALAGVALGSCGPVNELEPLAADMTAPIRIETTAATFIVRDTVAADFQKLLAGEPTENVYYADVEAP